MNSALIEAELSKEEGALKEIIRNAGFKNHFFPINNKEGILESISVSDLSDYVFKEEKFAVKGKDQTRRKREPKFKIDPEKAREQIYTDDAG